MEKMEFTLKRVAIFLSLVALLSSCMYEGDPGRVFIKLEPTPRQYVQYYWDNNDAIPYDYLWGVEYQTATGWFDYEYALGDGYVYTGSYSLSANPGFNDTYGGSEGPDRHYTFYVYEGGGFTDYYEQGRALEADLQFETLPDTVFHFDGFDMQVTRARRPAAGYVSPHKPKFVADR